MFTQKIDDGICKGFKNEEELDFFINKAFDEESNTHCLLVYIPTIPELEVHHIQQPIAYESEAERDRVYTEQMNEDFVNQFYAALYNQIIENKKNKENGTTTSEAISE
jgi:hypothetical protein